MASQRDVAEAWHSALERSGLPLAPVDGPRSRPRISFGAPLPAGMAAEAELIDVVLIERWPVWRVRMDIERVIPTGWRLVELFDVWLAGPALAGRVAAADYRIELADAVDPDRLARAVRALLDADALPRERVKGTGVVRYDLRPLLVDLTIRPDRPGILFARTRFHPELGTGRPDEVVAALADAMGSPFTASSITRERVLLQEDIAGR